jgi:hypothetical protein
LEISFGMKNGVIRLSRLSMKISDLQAGLAHRLLGRAHRVLDEEVHLADVLLFDPVQRLEIGHLARNLRRIVGDIETGDRADAGSTSHQGLPILFDPGAQRRDEAQSGHDHPTVAVNLTSHDRSATPSARRLA